MRNRFREIPSRMSQWMSEHGDLHPFWDREQKQDHRVQAQVTNQPHYGRYGQERETTPCCDVCETKEGYFLYFDLPGVQRKDIDIEMDENRVTVTGERRRIPREGSVQDWYSEVDFGEFQRSLTLPEDVDPENVEANFENGVLMVHLPKIQSPRQRKIPVR